MIPNSYYTSEIHGPYQMISIGELELEDGGMVPDCQLAVATWGELNEKRDNAVLVTTWFGGTHFSWAENYIGPDHALDPRKYFIIAVNQIGNGLSVSPHNATGKNSALSMSAFPQVRISDDVRAQERLLREHFGIERLELVVGGSMGAQQTWEWLVRYPDRVARGAPIAGTAQNTPHDALFGEALMEQIRSDTGWRGGEYSSHAEVSAGLMRHAHLWGVLGFSTEFWKQELWRPLQFNSKEHFVQGFLEEAFAPVDPNALLTMAWKWQHGDVARNTGGDLAKALGRVKARVFVLAIDEDMFFPPRDCAAEQVLTPNSELRIIEDPAGHLALHALSPTFMPQIDEHLTELLST